MVKNLDDSSDMSPIQADQQGNKGQMHEGFCYYSYNKITGVS